MLGIIDYIKDNEFRINIYEKKVNIVNYIELLLMEENKIIIKSSLGRVIINGNNLIVKKLLNKELLIIGQVNKLEIGD